MRDVVEKLTDILRNFSSVAAATHGSSTADIACESTVAVAAPGSSAAADSGEAV